MVPLPGVLLAGRYLLDRPLAKGGMGAVWLARHRELGTEVAVKFMDPALIASSDARARFEREARASAMLDSQHVVHVHDYGVEDGTPYLVMERLRGQDLSERLRARGTLSLAEGAKIATQVSKALRRAHEAGVVHRDLKPGNVFFAEKDDDEVIKVLDFGIAKILQPEDGRDATRTGTIMGSVHYMSPEQVRDSKSADPRSDLWSLGIVLYQALTGSVPFPGSEIGDVLVRICTEPVKPPSERVGSLGPAVDAFFERALQRDRERRFGSAREMAEAFEALLTGAPAPTEAPRTTLPLVESASSATPATPELTDDGALVQTLVLPRETGLRAPGDEVAAGVIASQPSTQPGVTRTLAPSSARPPAKGARAWVWGLGAVGLVGGLAVLALRGLGASGEASAESPVPAASLQEVSPAQVEPPPAGSPSAVSMPSAAASAPEPSASAAATAPLAQRPSATAVASSKPVRPVSGPPAASASAAKGAAPTPKATPTERPVDLP